MSFTFKKSGILVKGSYANKLFPAFADEPNNWDNIVISKPRGQESRVIINTSVEGFFQRSLPVCAGTWYYHVTALAVYIISFGSILNP